MNHDENEPALARLADDGNPNAGEAEADVATNRKLLEIAAAVDDGALVLAADAERVELLDALLTISCHAVANLHPESCRDIPAEALDAAARRLALFYPDTNRASEVAQVWIERAAEVKRWRQRRLERDTEPPAPPSAFPAAIAGAYSQKVHGSPGVFATHEIDTDSDGQPVVRERVAAVAIGPALPPAAERKLQQHLAHTRAVIGPSYNGDTAALDAYMTMLESGIRATALLALDVGSASKRKAPRARTKPAPKGRAKAATKATTKAAPRGKRGR